MAIVDYIIKPEHRRIVAVIAVLSVLGACSPSQPEPAPDATASALVDAMGVIQGQTVYPVPVVSSRQPANPWSAPGSSHSLPTVAAGNGIYLVTWTEVVGFYPDILGVRVRASDGALLDSSPLLIATGPNTQIQPAVAFDGTNFLVVWEEIRFVPGIYGTRIRASDGAVLDPEGLYISRTPMGGLTLSEENPAVAFDGANYLVTWQGNYYDQGSVYFAAQAIRVRPTDGSCVEANSTVLAHDARNTRVAYTDGVYLVTWARGSVAEALLVSASTGQPVSSSVISLGAVNSNMNSPTVAAGNGEFLATWIGADTTLWARRVRASDGIMLDAADIAVGPAAAAAPEATFDGVDYRILWQGTRDDFRWVLTTRVSSQGVVAADAELELIDVEVGGSRGSRGGIAATAPGTYLAAYLRYDSAAGTDRTQIQRVTEEHSRVSVEIPAAPSLRFPAADYGSAIAVGNGIYLVVWSEYESASGRSPDILGVRVRASDGARLDATPLHIGYMTSVDIEPAVAFDGTNFLVVWEQISGPPAIYGARVRASDGVVLDPTPFHISLTSNNDFSLPETSPAVAFDGTNYLVAWNGYYYTNGTVLDGVQAIRVRTDGTIIESSSTALSASGGGGATRVASVDGTSLVTWNRGQNLEGVRISATTGQVLDAQVLTLATGGAHASTLAAQDGEFLVAWIGGDNALWARRVRASDGARLDAADIAVAQNVGTYPAATFDGQDYRIAWPDSTSAGRHVFNQRVSRLGVVASSPPLLISNLHPSASGERGGIAAASPGHFLASYTNYTSLSKNRVKLRLVSDVHTSAQCPPGRPLPWCSTALSNQSRRYESAPRTRIDLGRGQSGAAQLASPLGSPSGREEFPSPAF